MSTLEISKDCWKDHRTIKKVVENITKLRIWNKGNGFKNLLPQDEHKLKWIIAKQPLLISPQVFEKPEIEGTKKDKRCWILGELASVKNP